jgi:hypothetical protein
MFLFYFNGLFAGGGGLTEQFIDGALLNDKMSKSSIFNFVSLSDFVIVETLAPEVERRGEGHQEDGDHLGAVPARQFYRRQRPRHCRPGIDFTNLHFGRKLLDKFSSTLDKF